LYAAQDMSPLTHNLSQAWSPQPVERPYQNQPLGCCYGHQGAGSLASGHDG